MIRFADNKLANNIIKKNLECFLKKSLNEKERNETVVGGRSRNETVINISRKVRRLKQNQERYCFKAWTLVHFKGLFQKLDLDSGEFF